MKKILLIVSAIIVAIVLVAVFVVKQQSGYTKVLTAKIHRQDLATVVSGTGQVKPKTSGFDTCCRAIAGRKVAWMM